MSASGVPDEGCLCHMSGAVASWLEHRTLNQQNGVGILLLPFRSLGNCFHSMLPQFSQLKLVNVYSGGYVICSLRAVVATWPNASQRSRVGAGVNRSARG